MPLAPTLLYPDEPLLSTSALEFATTTGSPDGRGAAELRDLTRVPEPTATTMSEPRYDTEIGSLGDPQQSTHALRVARSLLNHV